MILEKFFSWYLKLVSPFGEDSSLIGSIVASVIAKELEKWKEKIFLKPQNLSEKVKTLPTKTFVILGSKDEVTHVSDVLFQRLVNLANGCNISFDNWKSHEMRACAEQVHFYGGFILRLILWDKNIKWQYTELKRTSYLISSFRNAIVSLDDNL